MLQKMGWKDGLGLGKKNQGRTEIIQTQSRMAQSGLGNYIFDLSPKLSCMLYQIIFRNFTTLAWPKWFLQRCGEKNPVEQIQWPGRLSCQIISCYWEGTLPFQLKNFVILLLLSDVCLLPFLVWIQILTVALVLVWFGRKYPNLINIHTSLWEHSRFLWNPIKHKAFTSVRGIRYI